LSERQVLTKEARMSYYLASTVDLPFERAKQRVVDELKREGFGVLTEIDVRAMLEKKLGVTFRNCTILGACNPPLACRALQAERTIGAMLPCNVIVQDAGEGRPEVAAIDPLTSVQAAANPELAGIAKAVREKPKQVAEQVG
jgi:uncharacterized protein (DUF302 family)